MNPRWEGVPRGLARTLLEAGWTDHVLGALVTCREDGRPILDQLVPGLQGRAYEQSLDEIWALARGVEKQHKRKVAALAQAAKQPRLQSSSTEALTTGEAYDSLVAGNIELSRRVFKSRRDRMLQLEGAAPEDIEMEETKRWAAEIARFISPAELPAKWVAEGTTDPMATWMRLCGNRRPRTLRQSARSWAKFHSWMQLAHGVEWPPNETMVIDYMEELAQGGCPPSLPSSLLNSLQVMEAIGGIPREARLGLSPMLMNVVRNMGKTLGQGGPPKRTAPVFTVAMVIAAELGVCREDGTVVFRLLCFVMLLMVWCSMRTDDTLWIDRSRLTLSELGLRGVLLRTKTSGAGRKVKELPIFVSRLVSLSGQDWMREGMELYENEAKRFPGVLFLCRPRRDGDGFTKKYLDSTLLASWMKWALGKLGAPKRALGLWVEDPTTPLVPEEWRARWSGHSARHCLPSWSAALGVPSEQRAFVGRWKAGVETDANSYVLTSRQIVQGVQDLVVKALSTGEPKSFIETEVLEDLRSFAMERGLEWRPVLKLHQIWMRKGETVALWQKYPLLAADIWGEGLLADEGELALLDTENAETRSAPYWVSISRKTGFRRLHRQDGCGVRPSNVFSSEEVWDIKPETADKKCLICFRDSRNVARDDEAGSTSGSSTSSSSESEERMDD